MVKQKTFRSKTYLKWVKTLDCCMCGSPADDAHHIIGTGNMGGMGTKAPDNMTMPVCRGDHYKIHHDPELWDQQWEHIARTQNMAIEQGVLTVE